MLVEDAKEKNRIEQLGRKATYRSEGIPAASKESYRVKVFLYLSVYRVESTLKLCRVTAEQMSGLAC
jgi:hypothetical protein